MNRVCSKSKSGSAFPPGGAGTPTTYPAARGTLLWGGVGLVDGGPALNASDRLLKLLGGRGHHSWGASHFLGATAVPHQVAADSPLTDKEGS